MAPLVVSLSLSLVDSFLKCLVLLGTIGGGYCVPRFNKNAAVRVVLSICLEKESVWVALSETPLVSVLRGF